jgi:hypothetical protein
LKPAVVEQYQTLNNIIMNDYYEANMPSHSKPQQSTDTKAIDRFIKDKYIKKLWVNEDDEDPVELYQSGELDKRMKKKAKKDKKKQEKRDKKKQDKKNKKEAQQTQDASNLIDFQEGDDFGDFQEPNQQSNKQDDGFGDLLGGDDDFGDFVAPEKRDDDDFGDFADPTINTNTGIDMNVFNSALAQTNNQSNAPVDINSKYAALESMNNQIYPQQQQQQQMQQPAPQNSDIFFGMNIGGNNFNYQQPPAQPQNAFDNTGFPNLNHQYSYPPTPNNFPAQTLPAQPFGSAFNGSNMASQGTSQTSSNYSFSSNTNSYNSSNPAPSMGPGDIFGLKETLKKKNKLYKYNNVVKIGKAETGDKAFSGLVSTQWNS